MAICSLGVPPSTTMRTSTPARAEEVSLTPFLLLTRVLVYRPTSIAAVIIKSFCCDVFMVPRITVCQLDVVLDNPSLASMTLILPSCIVVLEDGRLDCAPVLCGR